MSQDLLQSDDPIAIEAYINKLIARLNEVRKQEIGTEIPDYEFNTLNGPVNLSQLFRDDSPHLLVIHNMGIGCSYCTMWADGFNGLLPHLENALSVVLASKDPPPTQKDFATTRNWSFRLVSHQDKPYYKEQTHENCPGAAVYERRDGKIYLKNRCDFGPEDLYCPTWTLLGMAGIRDGEWTAKFSYD